MEDSQRLECSIYSALGYNYPYLTSRPPVNHLPLPVPNLRKLVLGYLTAVFYWSRRMRVIYSVTKNFKNTYTEKFRSKNSC